MNINLNEVSDARRYQLMVNSIAPRPIAWVSTLSEQGVANLAPYSFFTVASVKPPVLAFVPSNPADQQYKDTLLNLQATKECVVNVVPHDLAAAMNETAANLPPDQSEFAFAAIEQEASQQVAPPSVKASPVRYECRLREVVSMGDHAFAGQLVLLDVLNMVVLDEVLEGDMISPEKLDLVGRMGGTYYSTTRDRFELNRPS